MLGDNPFEEVHGNSEFNEEIDDIVIGRTENDNNMLNNAATGAAGLEKHREDDDDDDEDMDMEGDEIDDDSGPKGEKKSRLETGANNLFELPEFTRKDKTLQEILEMMQDNPPIIPDAVIDYYLMKNGMNLKDIRIKRLLALATQKFVSDIATDAYEYSRIRSSTAVQNANNGQAKARQLLMGQQQQQMAQQQEQQGNGSNENNNTVAAGSSGSGSGGGSQQQNDREKVVLTVNDLSSAVAEYGLNVGKPDFYR
ncbi:hypothetical protein ACO0QE_002687 [Hanseniaspora vineae]